MKEKKRIIRREKDIQSQDKKNRDGVELSGKYSVHPGKDWLEKSCFVYKIQN